MMIGDMRNQIKDMDEELQRTLRSNDQLELLTTDKNLRIETLQKETKQLRQQIAEKEKLIKLFVEDLHKLYTDTDAVDWKAGLKQM